MRHICQSDAWAEFKTKMGTPAVKAGDIWFTVHPLPKPFNFLPWKVGYCPKVPKITKKDWEVLSCEGRNYKGAFVKVESNVVKSSDTDHHDLFQIKNLKFKIIKSSRTFASHTYLLDLAQSEDQLLANLHPKTRYNIKVAQKHGVSVEQRDDDEALEIFLKLQRETADRQHFYIHPDLYYQTLWETLKPQGLAHLILAKFGNEYLSAFMLFNYDGVLYYPYGGTSDTHRKTMASTLLMWEAVRFGKTLGCHTFDMWGASATDDPSDPWSGFTRFKKGFGGKLVEFEDTYDLVLNKPLYFLLTLGNKLRWFFLRLSKR